MASFDSTFKAKHEKPDPSFLESLDPRALPAMVGNNWSDDAFRKNHHKSQNLQNEFLKGKSAKGVPMGRVREGLPDVQTTSALQMLTTNPAYRGAKDLADMEPTHATLDDKAFRFAAYFTEEVHESPTEKSRVRFVSIHYYPSDHTLMIVEPRVPNSGLQGGTLLKRGKVPATVRQREERPDEAFLSISHLNVGTSVKIYGQVYTLYDCDDETRYMMGELGIDVPPPTQPPADFFTATARARQSLYDPKGSSMGASRGGGAWGIRSQAYEGDGGDRGRRFVADSGKTLRFYGQWDDRESVGGVVRELEIRYFIEDDTMSIKETQSTNEAVQAGFLGRQRLPKDMRAPTKAAELTFAGRKNGVRETFTGRPDSYYCAEDLYVGMALNVLGRTVVVTDCDLYTREYYANVIGIEQGEAIEGYGNPKTLNAQNVIGRRDPRQDCLPPHTGFGDPEDAAQSCKGLVLVAPRKRAPLSNDGEVLRYELRLNKPERAEDAMRRFLLNYYVDDGEVMLQESTIGNSGFTGGRFLRKQRICLNAEATADPRVAPIYLTQKDLFLGAELVINKFKFVITQVDLHTENYLAHKSAIADARSVGLAPETDPVDVAAVKEALVTLQQYINVRYMNLTEAFRAFDEDKDNKITIGEMKKSLRVANVTARDAVAMAVLRSLDKSKNGFVSYADWFASLGKHTIDVDMDSINGGGGVAASSSSSSSSPIAAGAAASSGDPFAKQRELQLYSVSASSKELMIKRDRTLRKLKEKLESRHLNCFEMFRMISNMPRAYKGRRSDINAITNIEKDSFITPVQLRRCVQETLGLMFTDEEMGMLLEFYFPEMSAADYGRRSDVPKDHMIDLNFFQSRFVEMVRIGTLENRSGDSSSGLASTRLQ